MFYSLKLFGDLVKNHETICEGTSDGAYAAFAVKGVPADAKPVCTVLDYTHDLAEHPVSFKDGTLAIRKNDSYSAAFLVEFGE